MCSSTSWRERTSSARIARGASCACSGRTTPSASTLRSGGSWRAARARRRRLPLASSQASSASSRRAAQHRVDAARPCRCARTGSPRRSCGLPARRMSRRRPSWRGARRSGARYAEPAGRSLAQAFAHAPGAVRDHRQSRRAAPAHHVPRQPASVRSSRRSDGACPRRDVEAPRRPAARVGARASARSRASAPVRRCSTAAPATYSTRAPRARRRAGDPATPARRRRARATRRTRPRAPAPRGGSPCSRPTRTASRCPARRGRAS